MTQNLDYLAETASQTAGPLVHIGLAQGAAGFEIFETELGQDISGPYAEGARIRLKGLVIEAIGTPPRDVLIEVWPANAAGICAHPEDPRAAELEDGFRGCGWVISDFASGAWTFDTVKPGIADGAPHISFWIGAQGINIGLSTQMYFADEAEKNDRDPILNLIEQETRRCTLIASRVDGGDMPVYCFEIRPQGEGETVFLDI